MRLAPLLLLAGCATVPPAPDPAVDVVGRWTIVAVDGEPTGGGARFYLDVEPPSGTAQFGCNRGSGPLSTGNGWLVPGDPWIATVAACVPNEKMRFERRGFAILTAPLAIERLSNGGIRLRNERGSLELSRP